MVHKLTKYLAKHFIQKTKHFFEEVFPEEVIELEYFIQEKKKNSSIVNLNNTDSDNLVINCPVYLNPLINDDVYT